MHIPKSPTTEIEVLSFEKALSGSAVKNYDSDKWLYVPDFYSEYRYILGTRGKNPLICIGVNPSTAEPGNLDNTLKSAERIAHFNEYDSFVMFNVYAQRATSPDDMERVINPTLHSENMKAFEYILSLSPHPSVWAAWGSVIEKRDYLARCVADMVALGEKYGARWYTAGKRSVKNGNPHHPLYLRSETKLDEFDAAEYCGRLINIERKTK